MYAMYVRDCVIFNFQELFYKIILISMKIQTNTGIHYLSSGP